jgi:hypothetical protein
MDNDNLPPDFNISEIPNIISRLQKNNIYRTNTFILQIYDSSSTSQEKMREIAINNNLTFVDFKECFQVIKYVWNIKEEDEILIGKFEYIRNNKLTNQIEYILFNPDTNEKIDLSICSNLNIKINYSINVNISDNNRDGEYDINLDLARNISEIYGIDLFNLNDSFYNEICTNFTSEKGTDVTLNDRRTYYYKNISFCEEHCTYLNVDFNNYRVECACPVKLDIDEEINDNEEIDYFSNEVTSSNFEVIYCYKLVFNIDKFKVNIGSFICLALILFQCLIFLYYCSVGMKPFIREINKIMKGGNPPLKNKKNNNLIDKKLKNNFINKSTRRSLIFDLNNNNYEIENEINLKKNLDLIHQRTENILSKSFNNIDILDNNESYFSPPNNKTQEKFIFKNNYLNEDDMKRNGIKIYKKTKKNGIHLTVNQTDSSSIKINKLNDKSDEIQKTIQKFDEMTYEEALKNDKRDMISIYIDFIFTKHIILCLFFKKNVIFRSLKLSIFLITEMTDFFFNAFFYTDKYISKMYREGEISFLLQLPKSILALLITNIFIAFLEYLISMRHSLKIKKGKKKSEFFRECNETIHMLKIKFVCYFIILFIAIIFYWYYISAFCAVYKNSQYNLIKSSFISYGIDLLQPFGTCFIAAIMRKFSLEYKKKILFCIHKTLLFLD